MKHLLVILISFLLLSSPVIGHPKGEHTLYKWKTLTGDVWKTFGDIETHQKYQGEVENGVPNGLGISINPSGRGKYVGGWKNGGFHGHGTLTWSDGTKYVGGWKDWKKNGKGIDTFPDGKKLYIGKYRDGKRWSGIEWDKKGYMIGRYMNGEWIEQ